MLLAIALALVFGGAVAVTLPSYGITWDEPENFEMGERYFLYLISGDSQLLDTRTDARPRHLRHSPGFTSPWSRVVPEAIWPVSNVLSACTFYVFGDSLGTMDPVDAHHVMLALLCGIGVIGVYALGRQELGPGWALFAVVALVLWPRFFGHAHNNVKDVPLAVFFLLTVLSGYRWVRTGAHWWILLLGISFGAALGTRPNGLFAWIVLAGWVLWRRPYRETPAVEAPPTPTALRGVAGLGIAALMGGLLVWVLWPLVRVTPETGFPVEGVTRPFDYVGHAIDYVRAINDRAQNGWNLYSPYMLAIVTPIPTLLLATWGFVVAIGRAVRRRAGDDLAILLVLWTILTLVRTMTPWGIIYDGVRHLMEIVPAMALLAAMGASDLVARIRKRTEATDPGSPSTPPRWRGVVARPTLMVGGVMWLGLLPGLYHLIDSHPYQTTYFNSLVGGLGGAQSRGVPFACDYWASSYRNAARWLNAHAEPRAIVNIPVAGHLAPWIGLRDDLRWSATPEPGHLQVDDEGTPVYLLLNPRRTSTQSLGPREVPFHRFHPAVLGELALVQRVERQGGIVYEIYRADGASIERLRGRWPELLRPWPGDRSDPPPVPSPRRK